MLQKRNYCVWLWNSAGPLRRDRDELEDYLRLGPGRKQIAGRLGMKNCAGLGGGRWSWTLTFAKFETSQSRRRPRIGPFYRFHTQDSIKTL